MVFEKIPIVETARRCGLVLDSRTLRRSEVEASCPFCGDHGRGKYHLSLNTDTDQYRCNLCGAHGNSITLYARLNGVSNKEAYREMAKETKVYPMPQQPAPQNTTTERQPLPPEQRHAMYSDMLEHLTLLPKHEDNLLERGLSKERMERNQYRSMPETEQGRRLLAGLLRTQGHDLLGLPGFRTYYGEWTISGPNGFLIPVRDKDGLIQGMKIRLDDADEPDRKYRWLSSRGMPNGTRSYSWVHVTGDVTQKWAFLTEGPLKGDVASYLAREALFVCIGGVNALGGLKDTIHDLGVTEVVEAMDMDQMTNVHVEVIIMVSDIDECLKLFCDTLGMKVVFEARNQVQPAKGLTESGNQIMNVLMLRGEGGVDLEIHQYVDPPARKVSPMEHGDLGAMHFMLRVSDIDATVKSVEALGYKLMAPVTHSQQIPGFAFTYFRGPNDVMIELHQGKLPDRRESA